METRLEAGFLFRGGVMVRRHEKMMQFMPLVFGVMMALFPSGLVLYWVTNGSLGLLQQWWVGKKHAKPPTSPDAKGKSIVSK